MVVSGERCRTARIVIEAAHEEMSAGFMECSIRHCTGVDIADQGALFKLMAKTVAQRRGLLLTFMARWSNQADGQSGHVHISLRGTNGETTFHDAAADRGMSQTMRYFLGGMQTLMPELLLMPVHLLDDFLATGQQQVPVQQRLFYHLLHAVTAKQ